jgi:hypothetical protein
MTRSVRMKEGRVLNAYEQMTQAVFEIVKRGLELQKERSILSWDGRC